MSELKVNSIKGTGASPAAITIDSSSGGFSGSDKFFKYAQSMHDFSCSSLAAIFFLHLQ